jgi:uncharacterized protein
MDIRQINALLDSCTLPCNCNKLTLKETHISWVILSDDYAFKIKRPVKYSFLDFSTLERRKHFCHEEVRLNKRLAPEMYLDVLPVTEKMLSETPDGNQNDILDYAVRMKRMDNDKEMDNLLRYGDVSDEHIDKLAEKISRFHDSAEIIKKDVKVEHLQGLYADIKHAVPFLTDNDHEGWDERINDCIKESHRFLTDNKVFLRERVREGFHRDGHGDLNSRNIFLYDEPLIFDCIEFNAEFRQIDVLNEIAFLCMDLDFFEKERLSELFFKNYSEYAGIENNGDAQRLFTYYKSYRANIRAKVTLLKAKKKKSGGFSGDLDEARRYLRLMERYKGRIG